MTFHVFFVEFLLDLYRILEKSIRDLWTLIYSSQIRMTICFICSNADNLGMNIQMISAITMITNRVQFWWWKIGDQILILGLVENKLIFVLSKNVNWHIVLDNDTYRIQVLKYSFLCSHSHLCLSSTIILISESIH